MAKIQQFSRRINMDFSDAVVSETLAKLAMQESMAGFSNTPHRRALCLVLRHNCQ